MNRTGLVVIAALVVALAGCGGGASEQAAIGLWKGNAKLDPSLGLKPISFSLDLKKDKTFVMENSEGKKETGEWAYVDGRIELLFSEQGEVGFGGAKTDRVSTVIMAPDGKGLYHRTSDLKGEPDFLKAN